MLPGCATIMAGMEFMAEVGECMAGVDCIADPDGFDGIPSDDGTSAIAAGTRSPPVRATRSEPRTKTTGGTSVAAQGRSRGGDASRADDSDAESAASVHHINGKIQLCLVAGAGCWGAHTSYFVGGELEVRVLEVEYDDVRFDYQVRFANASDCRITIATTMMRHGDTLNAQTLDFGNLYVNPRQTELSRMMSFTPSRSEGARYSFVVFSYSGLATCRG